MDGKATCIGPAVSDRMILFPDTARSLPPRGLIHDYQVPDEILSPTPDFDLFVN